ncbi:carbon-nitrogen hydrolase family protein [Anaerosinus sp.]|uniref:carbon-nitrogen hydrolase family protein n=1 Tax=Selenobaculum sp. TaxID=3074374 RepID=UPI003AB905C6
MGMKIALLHLNLSGGPQEKNLKVLCKSIKMAAKSGAKWILTPEMALQGYFFTQLDREYVWEQEITNIIQPVLDLAKELQVTVFLGCGELDHEDGKKYNSCLIIDAKGEIIDKHRKLKIVGSTTEGWSTAGKKLTCLRYEGVSIGVLVCADAWYGENGVQLGEMGAELILVIAAWPPGCGGPPEKAWERCSKMSGGRPVIVCNQTGNTRGMNCFIAKSAAIIDGELKFSYQGEAAILMMDFNKKEKVFTSTQFNIISFT